MTSFKTAIAIAIGTLFAGAAFAQSNFEIEQRDRNEQARINQGIRSGELTRYEADRLQGERAQIERMERRARADGVLTQSERARIDHAQDRLGRDIYRESHDRQTSNGYGRQWDNRGNGWGRGNEHRGYEQHGFDHRGNEQRGFDHGQRNDSHANGSTPHTGGTGNSHSWTPRTGTTTHTSTSMPQAQARSTPSQGTRTYTAARGDSGRRTR